MKKLGLLSLLMANAVLVAATLSAEPAAGAISPESAYQLLNRDKTVILIDVRTREEFTAGHIADARWLPYDKINARSADALIGGKDVTVVVYCRSGHRSGLAAKSLRALGYTKVLDLGGIIHWPYPVVSGEPK